MRDVSDKQKQGEVDCEEGDELGMRGGHAVSFSVHDYTSRGAVSQPLDGAILLGPSVCMYAFSNAKPSFYSFSGSGVTYVGASLPL